VGSLDRQRPGRPHKCRGLSSYSEKMKEEVVTAAIILAIVVAMTALIRHAYGEQLLCHLEPGGRDWHYRTKIPPMQEEKCWYDGPRMMARERLYWAESPKIAPTEIVPTDRPPWQQEWRWIDPTGRTHQE